jgi:hypothetical protein
MVVGWLTASAAHAINCGDTLGPGGRFILPADLDCGTVSPALTVRDGAQLDLGGHTISGRNVVILLEGQGGVLHNGIIESATGPGVGIQVAGEGGHTVRRVHVSGGAAGIVVTSDHNRLITNVVTGVFGPGPAFGIGGHQNLVTSNVATGGQAGFIISGDDNRLVENTYTASSDLGGRIGFDVSGNQNLLRRNHLVTIPDRGFIIRGEGNRLVENLMFGNAMEGISVSGQETEIVRNVVVGNSTDLVDTHEACDNNRWTQNVFRTSRAGATENPACIQ